MSDNPQYNQTFFWNRPQATPSPPIFVPPQPSTVQPSWTDPTVDTNGIETFYEIGSPLQPREKREIVVFPEDELLPANATIDDVSIEFQSAADERAARQILQTITKIDVGPQSQLFVAPGSTSVIYFEVTNLRNEPTYHNFNVQDEKRYLRQMEPRFLWLMPNQRESVRVTILVPQGSELGSKDKITFTSQSVVQVQQSVMVTVSSTGVVDSWQPRIWYTYNTRCDWRWNCVGGTWSIEVVARDV
ncbi:hypothetical protein PVAND_002947 [Polypedilum vanderplanki]|uniref:Uncharacterized protein n=1 Tax=Polypedilum vanderplanki TaxID=319348 RepID=A0A9J6BSZ6_POLVA|nr:hypothetical protein PVAND_002947 [Polypedilum vanderplanki]